MSTPRVVLYRDSLLATSEVFVKVQGESLGVKPLYAGSRYISGVDVPRERSVVINDGGPLGRLREIIWKASGRPPSAFIEALDEYRPNLVHAHFGIDGCRMLDYCVDRNIPLVTTFHGYDITIEAEALKRTSLLFRRYVRLRPRLKREGTLFIAVSDFIRSRLIEDGFPADRIVRHYIGVDVKQFRPDPAVERENILLFVGRFSDEKGGAHFIRAATAVQRDHPDLRVIMIGQGERDQDWKNLAGQIGLRCEFLGAQTHDQIKQWFRRAKVFCLPSTLLANRRAEGFGLVFIEAAASGLPTVTFDSGGVPEAVQDGVSGFVVQDGRWQLLEEKIRLLLRDNELWKRLSHSGRERTVNDFDLRRQSQMLDGIYADLLKSWKQERRQVAASP